MAERKVYIEIVGRDGVSRTIDAIGKKFEQLKREVGTGFKTPRQIEDKTVLADVKRYETERANIAKQNTALINGLRKLETKTLEQEVKAQDRSFKAAMNSILRTAKETSEKTRSAFSESFKGSFLGSLAGNLVASFTAQIARLPGIVSDYIGQAVDIASERSNALKGLESIATFKGIDDAAAKTAVQNLRLPPPRLKTCLALVSDLSKPRQF
jgi:hypothetical protein